MKFLVHGALFTVVVSAFAQGNEMIATQYPGRDASEKINACILAVVAAGGGTCDASGFGGTQEMSQQIDLGSREQGKAKAGVALLLPMSATWRWHLTDGKSCGIRQFGRTALVGNETGGGGGSFGLTVAAGSNMDSIYCTDDDPTGVYLRAQGFSVYNNQAATFANGVVHVRNVVDESSFTRVYGQNYSGDAWHIDSACCGAKFDNIQGVSNGNIKNGAQGGIPLTVGSHNGNVRSISFYDSTFNQPGKGLPDIRVTGGGRTMGINFFGVYMEGNGQIDGTTPMVSIEHLTGPVHFFGGMANALAKAGPGGAIPSTKAVFQNNGVSLTIEGFEIISTAAAVVDNTAKTTVPAFMWNGNLGSLTSYATVVAPGVATR